MQNLLNRVLPFLVLLVLAGCRPGYEMHEGRMVFTDVSGNGKIYIAAEGADPGSFVQLKDREYGKDKNSVYWRGTKIQGAIPKSFTNIGHLYSRDEERVYWREETIGGADPKTFVILDGEELWSRDTKDIYFGYSALGVKRPDTFKPIDQSWATDGMAYYYIAQFKPVGILPSDFASTTLLNGSYALDKDRAYHETKPISGADPKTFRALSDWYAVDKNKAYWEATPIEDADLETFRLEGNFDTARDKNRIYSRGKPE